MKQVPSNFNARVNELLNIRTRMNTATGALRDRLGVQLAESQLEYTRDIDGTKRKDDRQGGTRKPTAAEIPGLQLFASQRQARALEGIEDVLRSVLGFPPHGPGDHVRSPSPVGASPPHSPVTPSAKKPQRKRSAGAKASKAKQPRDAAAAKPPRKHVASKAKAGKSKETLIEIVDATLEDEEEDDVEEDGEADYEPEE